MTYRTASATSFQLIICFTLLVVLAACDQNSDLSQVNDPPIIHEKKIPIWLDARVELSPQQWLIKRSLAKITDKEAELRRTEKLLIIAANKFTESPRMIANRVAQLEDMLIEHNINETAVNLLEWFTKLPDTETPHNFSALCQYYYNLRILGKTDDEIIHSILHI